MKEFEENEVQETLKKKEESQSPQKLSLRDLLEVQGGFDFDDYMRDCTEKQCYVGAVACTSNLM